MSKSTSVIRKSASYSDADYYAKARPEMVRFVPDGARCILEVGCAEGTFGASLKRTDSSRVVHGIELVDEAAKIAQHSLDKVYCGAIEDVLPALKEGQYDAIVFNDVLEHLAEPEKVLTDIKLKLANGGCVVASIPNIRHYRVLKQLLLESDFKYQDWGVLDRTHLRFFTKKSMERMFDASGFVIRTIEGIPANWEMDARWWRYLNLIAPLFRGRIDDLKFVQYAIVAQPKPAASS